MKYQVITAHRSEYPNPIMMTKGDKLIIGEKSDDNEIWNDWYLCEAPNHVTGWVPKQVITFFNDNEGEASEDYSAKELNVEEGEHLIATKELNGWVWCQNPSSKEEGWVPLENLTQI